MLFGCNRIKDIWQNVSSITQVNIGWKQIVCGFPSYTNSIKISVVNYIVSIIAYVIFKQNSICKFESLDYKAMNILARVKCEIKWYTDLLCKIDERIVGNLFYNNVCDNIHTLS